ncbi:MAG: hypothetical protein U0441_01550 [Polyangiaceae bacterium]
MAMNYGPPPGNFGPPPPGNFGPPQGNFGPPQGNFGPPGAPPKKKGLSTGCWIAIVIVLVFLGSIGAVLAYIGYKVSTDPEVQHVMGAVGDAVNLAAEAQSAPGTNELRNLGCEQAMALDMAKMEKLLNSMTDAGVTPGAVSGDVEKMVMCQSNGYGTMPTCDAAAKAYVKGASPRKKFMLSVQQHGKQNCTGVYAPDGSLSSAGP